MEGLHTQDLVVALLVVEHGCCEVLKRRLCCEGPVRLGESWDAKELAAASWVCRVTHCDPLGPYEELVRMVVSGMQVVERHK